MSSAKEGQPVRLFFDRISRFRVLCAVAAAFAAATTAVQGQEMQVHPVGTWVTPAPNPTGPTWQDFNELAARLQATEARLQAMNNYTAAAVVDTDSTYQPGSSSQPSSS